LQRSRRARGFTLTELVLIIVIIGILAVVVIPSFNSQPFLARGFFEEAMTAARHAQKLAVASGCPVQLQLAAGSYALRQTSGADCFAGTWDIAVAHPARPGGYTGTPPAGLSISAAGPIVFQPDGSSSGGGASIGSHSFTVQTTGHVSGS
jgi:MSHA pilin protein MshC